MSDNPTYKITYTGHGTRRGFNTEDSVISAVSYALSLLGKSGDNAKQLVADAPSVLANNVNKEQADNAKHVIQDAGGYVDVTENS